MCTVNIELDLNSRLRGGGGRVFASNDHKSVGTDMEKKGGSVGI